MAGRGVLVTGGTGFLGSYVSQRLVDMGHEVVIFDVSTDDAILRQLGIADEVEIHQGDVTVMSKIVESVYRRGVENIVHLASFLTPGTRSNPKTALEINVGGLTNVCEAARIFDDQVDRIVWASSTAVYAPDSAYGGEWVTEEDLPGPTTLYGASKLYNELQAQVYDEVFDVSTLGFRPTVAYGPFRESGASGFLSDLIRLPALGQPYVGEYGGELINWVYVKDLARVIADMAFVPESDLTQSVYNLGGDVLTIAEFGAIVEDVTGVEVDISDEGSLQWVEGIDVQTMRTDHSAAVEDLGYDPRSPRESIIDAVNSIRMAEGLERID